MSGLTFSGLVIAPVIPARDAWVERGAVRFNWSQGEGNALDSPDELLRDVALLAKEEGRIAGFYKKYGPFNFRASSSNAGRVWKKSLQVTSGPRRGAFEGTEPLPWVHYFVRRVRFLYDLGSGFNAKGSAKVRVEALLRVWPRAEDSRVNLLWAVEKDWEPIPQWGLPPKRPKAVLETARAYAQAEIGGFIGGPGRPGLGVKLAAQHASGDLGPARPILLCPTLAQAVGFALLKHFQFGRGLGLRFCKCGCGRSVIDSSTRGRPREFYEDRCKWRYAKRMSTA